MNLYELLKEATDKKSVALRNIGVKPSIVAKWSDQIKTSPRNQTEADSTSTSGEVGVYGPILSDADLYREIFGEDAISAKDFRGAMSKVEGDITVRINSPGGEINQMSEMVALLNERKDAGAKITTVNMGIAASAGADIFMQGDVRLMTKYAEFMVHPSQMGMFIIGSAADIESSVAPVVQRLRNFDNSLINDIVRLTGKGEEEVVDLIQKESWYNADQAIAEGFATGMFVNAKKDKTQNISGNVPDASVSLATLNTLLSLRR